LKDRKKGHVISTRVLNRRMASFIAFESILWVIKWCGEISQRKNRVKKLRDVNFPLGCWFAGIFSWVLFSAFCSVLHSGRFGFQTGQNYKNLNHVRASQTLCNNWNWSKGLMIASFRIGLSEHIFHMRFCYPSIFPIWEFFYQRIFPSGNLRKTSCFHVEIWTETVWIHPLTWCTSISLITWIWFTQIWFVFSIVLLDLKPKSSTVRWPVGQGLMSVWLTKSTRSWQKVREGELNETFSGL
jgi:hypothetical protein